MKNLVYVAVASLALLACSDVPSPVAPRPAPTQAPSASRGAAIDGRYIVVFRGGTDVDRESARIASATGGKVTHRYHAALLGMAIELPAAAAAGLAHNPNVALVEQDQIVTASTTQSGATWGLDRIDQRGLPLSSSYTYDATGNGVTAYIIDTGILFAHSEFGGRARTGVDEITANGNAADCNGHGTHVSGTVGGSTYGVAKGIALVAVRVLDCGGSGPNSGVIAGVDWVTADHKAHPGPAVANMSLGGSASSALDAAIASSVAAGVTYGVAAGNGNILGVAQNACNYSPSREPSAITVSATDRTDTKASWANYGTCVDIFAPGVSITSSWYDGGTNTISGTSMATPHVVGAAALYLQANPSATPAQVAAALTGNATLNAVKSGGTGSPNRLLYTAFIGGGSTGTQPVARLAAPSCSGLTCNFDASGSTALSGATYAFSFGDGNSTSGTTKTASHAYASAGSYTIGLTVTDANGTSTASTSVTVSAPTTPAPVARFTYSCTARSCTFNAGSSSNATTFAWNFGDGSTDGGTTPTHSYSANGNLTVTLTATGTGGSDTGSGSVKCVKNACTTSGSGS
jgi:subtilisin family serine protease